MGALAALAITGLPVPSSAATVTTYVVKAARNSSVDVMFGSAVTLDMGKTRVSGAGWYAGYYFQLLAGRPDAGHGEVWFSDFAYSSFARFALPLGDGEAVATYQDTGTTRRLPAGRYRLHVLGDRSTQVRIALVGAGRARTFTATRPTSVTATRRDITPSVAGQRAPGAVATELPIPIATAKSLTFVSTFAAYHATDHTATGAVNQCIGTPGRPVPCDGDRTFYGYAHTERHVQSPSTLTEAATGVAVYYPPDVLPSGSRAAHFSFATPAIIDKVAVVAFSLSY